MLTCVYYVYSSVCCNLIIILFIQHNMNKFQKVITAHSVEVYIIHIILYIIEITVHIIL